ncbi:MAG: hypothetical protein WA705_19340 [Candidatus Ozemobacteraceae bacterium]
MKMKTRVLSLSALPVVLVLSLILGILGCWKSGGGGDNPVGPVPTTAGLGNSPVGIAQSVQFRLVLPGQVTTRGNPAASLIPAIKAADLASVSVTFSLILVNLGNTATPSTTFTKTGIIVDGYASAIFSNIAALPCIGEVHIAGGKIASYADFHGAKDLISGDNVLIAVPKNSKMAEDFVAVVIKQITVSPELFSKASLGVISRIRTILSTLNTSSPTAYDDALTLYSNSLSSPLNLTQEQTALAPVKEAIVNALTEGNISQAVQSFVPENRAKCQDLLEKDAGLRSTIIEAMQTASLTYVAESPGNTKSSTDASRYGEMTVLYDGIAFKMPMVKVNGNWLIQDL